MVQGTSSHDYSSSKVSSATASSSSAWEKASAKRSGYEAVQRADKERQEKKAVIDAKYGAWGSTFKDRKNFSSMHHC